MDAGSSIAALCAACLCVPVCRFAVTTRGKLVTLQPPCRATPILLNTYPVAHPILLSNP